MKILSVVSTRPEIIKMAPVIKEIEKKGIDHTFVTTGQHYELLLFDKIIEDLGLPHPDYNLTIGSGTPGLHIGLGMLLIEKVLDKEKPDTVLSQGDTNSVLAAALAAHKNHYLFGHIEAGLRNYDFWMPEESNRRLVDHISNFLFAPTGLSKSNPLKENIPEERIYVTGNTVVDAIMQHLPLAERKSDIMKKVDLVERNYILLTYHRAENTTKEKLQVFIDIVQAIANKGHLLVYPIHPRTKNFLKLYGLLTKLKKVENLIITDPLGYLDFLIVMKNTRLILTDSGGLQEEGTVLKVPVLVMRNNTERPEALGKGCELVGLDKNKILSLVDNPPKPAKKSPFGDGKASKRIVDILMNAQWREHR